MLTLSGAAVGHAAQQRGIEVSGRRVETQLATSQQLQAVLPSLRRQFEMIDALQLPQDVAEFFSSVPIVLDPRLQEMNGEYARLDERWVVRVKPVRLPADRAIVLHELLHAYHHQVLEQPTPAIGRAYQDARQHKLYPGEFENAYFMKNAREFYAVIGELYLAGPSFRPPFRCSIVMERQPEFIEYLATQFGKRRCE